MPRRERPSETTRSEHWLRVAVNSSSADLNRRVGAAFAWSDQEALIWRSPTTDDDYAEYYDQAFLERLGLHDVRIPLNSFWPPSGPRWDGLARTESGKVLLVEAKAHVDESVDYGSKASPDSHQHISRALADAKRAFRAREDATWETPFYQYANRLAHLHFLNGLNGIDAYLLFIYFSDAPDVPEPCTREQWEGAIRLTKKCLGISAHPYQSRVKDLIISVRDLLSNPAPVSANVRL